VVQADGTVIYTDKPGPGAEEVKFKNKLNIISPGQTSSQSTSQNNTPPQDRSFIDPNSTTQRAAPKNNYQLSLTSPANEATVRSNEGKVTVSGSVTPQASGSFELYLNGQLALKNTSPSFHLEGLDRGEYEVQIRLVDQTGKLLASSPVSKFYLQKVSALLRAN
jgi:hypothetical protein